MRRLLSSLASLSFGTLALSAAVCTPQTASAQNVAQGLHANNIVLSDPSGNTLTLYVPSLGSSKTFTFPDLPTNSSMLLNQGNQMLNGSLSFGSATSPFAKGFSHYYDLHGNYIAFGAADNIGTPSSTYLWPAMGASGTFLVSSGSGNMSWTNYFNDAVGFGAAPSANNEQLEVTGSGSATVSTYPQHGDARILHSGAGTLGGSLTIENTATPAVGNAASLSFDVTNTSNYTADGSNASDAEIRAISSTASYATDLSVSVWNGIAEVEGIRVRHDGNVGIGVADPNHKLEVGGSFAAGNSNQFVIDASGNLTTSGTITSTNLTSGPASIIAGSGGSPKTQGTLKLYDGTTATSLNVQAASTGASGTYTFPSPSQGIVTSGATGTIAMVDGNNGVLVTNGTGIPSISSTLPNGLTINNATIGGTTSISTSGAISTSSATGITASGGPVTSGDASHQGSLVIYDNSGNATTIHAIPGGGSLTPSAGGYAAAGANADITSLAAIGTTGIVSASVTAANGNSLPITAGTANGTNHNGGDLLLSGGAATGSGIAGNVLLKSAGSTVAIASPTGFGVTGSNHASSGFADGMSTGIDASGNIGVELTTVNNGKSPYIDFTGISNSHDYDARILYSGNAGTTSGLNISSTAVASANSQTINAVTITPNYTNGAFTGVNDVALNVGGTVLAPNVTGSSAANGTLTLSANSATSGNTGTNSAVIVKVGNNAATTALDIKQSGQVSIANANITGGSISGVTVSTSGALTSGTAGPGGAQGSVSLYGGTSATPLSLQAAGSATGNYTFASPALGVLTSSASGSVVPTAGSANQVFAMDASGTGFTWVTSGAYDGANVDITGGTVDPDVLKTHANGHHYGWTLGAITGDIATDIYDNAQGFKGVNGKEGKIDYSDLTGDHSAQFRNKDGHIGLTEDLTDGSTTKLKLGAVSSLPAADEGAIAYSSGNLWMDVADSSQTGNPISHLKVAEGGSNYSITALNNVQNFISRDPDGLKFTNLVNDGTTGGIPTYGPIDLTLRNRNGQNGLILTTHATPAGSQAYVADLGFVTDSVSVGNNNELNFRFERRNANELTDNNSIAGYSSPLDFPEFQIIDPYNSSSGGGSPLYIARFGKKAGSFIGKFAVGGNHLTTTKLDQTNASVAVPTSLTVDGGVTMRTGSTVSVTSNNQSISVGDVSYIVLHAANSFTGANLQQPTGATAGQMLIISVDNSTAANTIAFGTTHTHVPSTGLTLKGNQTATFIYDGTNWLLTSVQLNS